MALSFSTTFISNGLGWRRTTSFRGSSRVERHLRARCNRRRRSRNTRTAELTNTAEAASSSTMVNARSLLHPFTLPKPETRLCLSHHRPRSSCLWHPLVGYSSQLRKHSRVRTASTTTRPFAAISRRQGWDVSAISRASLGPWVEQRPPRVVSVPSFASGEITH